MFLVPPENRSALRSLIVTPSFNGDARSHERSWVCELLEITDRLLPRQTASSVDRVECGVRASAHATVVVVKPAEMRDGVDGAAAACDESACQDGAIRTGQINTPASAPLRAPQMVSILGVNFSRLGATSTCRDVLDACASGSTAQR